MRARCGDPSSLSAIAPGWKCTAKPWTVPLTSAKYSSSVNATAESGADAFVARVPRQGVFFRDAAVGPGELAPLAVIARPAVLLCRTVSRHGRSVPRPRDVRLRASRRLGAGGPGSLSRRRLRTAGARPVPVIGLRRPRQHVGPRQQPALDHVIALVQHGLHAGLQFLQVDSSLGAVPSGAPRRSQRTGAEPQADPIPRRYAPKPCRNGTNGAVCGGDARGAPSCTSRAAEPNAVRWDVRAPLTLHTERWQVQTRRAHR